MFDLGGGELLLIMLAVLLLFGPKKLPELAQGLGKGLRSFRRAQQDFNDQITSVMREEERKKNDEWARPIEPMTVPRTSTRPEETPTDTEDPASGTIGDLNRIADKTEEESAENGSSTSTKDDDPPPTKSNPDPTP